MLADACAWTSPAAAILTVPVIVWEYPNWRFGEPRMRVTPLHDAIGASREPPFAARDDEAGGRALRESGVDHMLGGVLAIWARGGPPTDHDVDFLLREEDADRALDVPTEARFKTGPSTGSTRPGRTRTSLTWSSIRQAARSATSISLAPPTSRSAPTECSWPRSTTCSSLGSWRSTSRNRTSAPFSRSRGRRESR